MAAGAEHSLPKPQLETWDNYSICFIRIWRRCSWDGGHSNRSVITVMMKSSDPVLGFMLIWCDFSLSKYPTQLLCGSLTIFHFLNRPQRAQGRFLDIS